MIKRLLPAFILLLILTAFLPADEPVKVVSARVIEYRVKDEAGATGDSTLTITLKLTGEPLKIAREAGDIEITEATDNLGNKLSVKSSNEHFAPLGKRLIGSNLDDSGTLNLDLTAASRKAESIKKLSGTLKIRTYRHQAVLIDKVLQRLNQSFDNPLFKAHEFTVRVVDPKQALPGTPSDEVESLRQRTVCIEVGGDKDRVSGVELQTADDKPLVSRASSFSAGRTANFTRQTDIPLPADTAAKILIATDPQEISVPFSLENIPLP